MRLFVAVLRLDDLLAAVKMRFLADKFVVALNAWLVRHWKFIGVTVNGHKRAVDSLAFRRC